ncbi:glycoside hydrolase [Coemansia reversa NRRL 1564]|uniref:beta-N-acetylhexosaminidase n=1 Tax=Coemansia reversa (strain ATCC 12441 / NRRL 1564) TaxID=763665 RepID=A0A2G5B3M4_COERN|nr:glycoside hydrolase [Coemansia reversa NRRL 1564]|eukprot:PIA13595.1 glycoside hydrolase [Coemansia reversa NRRL 1564]
MEPDSADESNGLSPMHISTPTTSGTGTGEEGTAVMETGGNGIASRTETHAPRALHDTDPIAVNIAVDVAGAPENLREGLQQIVQNHNVAYFLQTGSRPTATFVWQVGFVYSEEINEGSYEVRCIPTADGEVSEVQLSAMVVYYRRMTEAFRALGQILTAARAAERAVLNGGNERLLSKPEFSIKETAQFETQTLMIDCSRNAVLGKQSVFAMLRNMALMGYNMLQLYTEDTFKVSGEPFFGYLRGGYTQDELKEIDDYAFNMGVEVVACIQTLGHLGQMLQWPQYSGLRDTNEVILCRLPETYALIEKLITTVTAPLRSKRIHIGMDEAYGVGEGRFRSLFGAQEGTAVFVEHLDRVHEICKRHGLRPMIWSDMLFCLAAKNNALYAYYDQSNNPKDALGGKGIPPDIDLVFWDYFHTIPEVYTRKIQQHRELGCENPWLAGSAWTHSRLWSYLPFSFETNRASLIAAKSPAGRVHNYMLTIWGDEGNECDFFSALPVMLYVANHGYTDMTEIDVDFMEDSFAAICGGSLGDWMFSCRIDELPQNGNSVDVRSQLPSNMSKWILWEDPMLSFMSPQYASVDLDTHYTQIADRLLDCALSSTNSGILQTTTVSHPRYPLNRLLRMPGLLARVLSLKCNLRERLVQPYKAGDRAALLQVAETRLRPLIEAQRELWLYHRARWHRIYKPFGWETIELRYGGLTARLQTVYDRIVAYAMKQPYSLLRRSRAIGVTAGVSRHPALLPYRSRNPSKVIDPSQFTGAIPQSSAFANTASVPLAPGPSMSTEEGSGLSVGNAPSWLPAITNTVSATMTTDALSSSLAISATDGGSLDRTDVHADVCSSANTIPATTVGLGWPVSVATATTAGTIPVCSGPLQSADNVSLQNVTTSEQSVPVMTTFPQSSSQSSESMAVNHNITTINALGVRELGGEGDFWLQPAPLLPPELDPLDLNNIPTGAIGCLGEEVDEIIDSIPELEEDLHCIYENSYTCLMLDYSRVTAPSRIG